MQLLKFFFQGLGLNHSVGSLGWIGCVVEGKLFSIFIYFVSLLEGNLFSISELVCVE